MLTVTLPIVPDFDVFASYARSAFNEKRFTNGGPLVSMLELRLREITGARNLVMLSNGTLALQLALRALGVKGEVITTPFTFCASTQSIIWAGATPVFVDIDPVKLTIDPAAIEAAITSRTEAILGVHVYGRLCDLEAIESIAQKHGLAVIYDGAHAFNISHQGKSVGSYGDATAYSFHATKLFHTAEGGAVETHASALAEKIRGLRNFGIESEDTITQCGSNAKMSELSAAMGLAVLQKFGEEHTARVALRAHYDAALAGVFGLSMVSRPTAEEESSEHYYVVRIDSEVFGQRDHVQGVLKANGVLARRYFYPLTSDIPLDGIQVAASNLSNARRASEEVLALPFHSGITSADVERIARIIRHELSQSR
jgi:dTDP-4-amino-4,6-dideoxygalactose transaminase